MSQLLNILVAYPYMDKGNIKTLYEHKDKIRFVLDSGAFTAWKAKKEIKLDDYCKFIEDLPFKPWRYFTLDVIGNPEASYRNYEIMLERGFNPVPIFTRGEDVSMIDKYYETSDVLGIGGLVGTKGSKGFIKGIMKHIGDRKVHWLGFTNFEYVRYYKPYMCDSSGWTGGERYGQFKLYTGKGKFKALKRTDFTKPPPQYIKKRLSHYGINYKKLQLEKNWRGSASMSTEINAISAVNFSMDMEDKNNTFLFNAASTNFAIAYLINSHKILTEGKK